MLFQPLRSKLSGVLNATPHVISSGDIIFDVGGHHGWNALILSRLIGPQGKLFTFEPNPSDNEDIHPVADTAELRKLGKRFHLYALPQVSKYKS